MDIQLKKKHPAVKYKYYIMTGVVVIALGIYLINQLGGPSKLRYDVENLQIVEVKQDKFVEYIDQEGIAQPKMTIKIKSLEGGTVDSIVAEEGSMLKKGDVILILKNPDLQRTIDDERYDFEKKKIAHRKEVMQMEKGVSSLKRTMLKTVFDLEYLSKKLKRDHEEYLMDIISKAELEMAVDEFNVMRETTTMLLEELKSDSLMNAMQMETMMRDMEREEQRFARTLEKLDHLIIRAPIDGQLSFVGTVYGGSVSAGSDIGEQKVISDLKLHTQISEYYIDRIFIGLPATVSYQNKKYNLKITKLNPEIKDRMFEVDLVFTDETPDNIRIGKTYRIQIELGQPEDALVIDKGSFYQNTGGQWIFKLDKSGNRAFRTNITVGRQNPGQYEVLEGLSVGDKVIISGYSNFGDAQELKLITK
jgi:HlyD family secretion protein